MAFDPSQFGATPVATPTPGAAPASSPTPTLAAAGSAPAFDASQFGAVPAPKVAPAPTPIPQPTPESTGSGGIVGDAAASAEDTYAKAPEAIYNEFNRGNETRDAAVSTNPIIKVGENALAGTNAFLNAIFAPFSGLSKGVTDAVSGAIENNPAIINHPVTKHIADFVTKAQTELKKLSDSHPEASRNIGNALGVALAALGGEDAGVLPKEGLDTAAGTVEGIKGAASDAVDATKAAAETTKEAIKQAPDVTKEAVGNKLTQMAKDSWAKPTTKAAGYKAAGKVFENAKSMGNDIPETLVKDGIKLSDNVDRAPNGSLVYATKDTAKSIRDDAATASNQLLRPSLEEANPGVQKVPVDDIVSNAKQSIAADKTITAGDKETLLSGLDKEGAALAKKYPDGMQLTDLHDQKITYGQNVKRNPFGDISLGLKNQTNESLRDAFKNAVEKNAPSSIPVKEVNAELQKRYQVADYLDALDGKKVPIGVGGRIANYAGKYAGLAIGQATGVGILGDVLGYHTGGMIENLLSNIPDVMRDKFLGNLQKENPEAFSKLTENLKQTQAERSSRLLLPAPEYIPLGAETFKGTSPEALKALQEANNTEQNAKIANNTKLPPLKYIKEGSNKLYNNANRKLPGGK